MEEMNRLLSKYVPTIRKGLILLSVRILHCGKSLENYRLCINEGVAGFTRRGPKAGDLIYLAVKVGKKTLCGARGHLIDVTGRRPWDDADSYPVAYDMSIDGFCDPFELSFLSELGGAYWNLKYLQGAKPIDDPAVQDALNTAFTQCARNEVHLFQDEDLGGQMSLLDEEGDELELEIKKELTERTSDDDLGLSIMGTFLTIKFHSEQHAVSGLETLVNRNFYGLFEDFPEERSILISDNRRFRTSGVSTSNNERVSGVSGIPDALLISFNKNAKCPLQINLIEYECYGEGKARTVDKFNYLNGHIIPQLMRFASTFSIVTDGTIREQTIRTWTDKVIDYIYSEDNITEKVAEWVRGINPEIREQQISLYVNKMLEQAFRTNIRVVLIIDELTPEQRDTIKNVINSFKLDAVSTPVDFAAYVVRLQQRINVLDSNAEYAISVQK